MAESRFSLGIETFRKVDPESASTLVDNLKDISPELARFTIEFGYGDVMSRPGLDLQSRELLTIAMLGAMGNAPLQLETHINGALTVGASMEQIVEVILQIAVFAGFPAAYNAIMAATKVFRSRKSPRPSSGEDAASVPR